MRKLFKALLFGAGAIFGMFFANKKGATIRKQVSNKESSEEKAEIIGQEAKAMFRNFWKTIRRPLKKSLEDIRKEMELQVKKYSTEAKQSVDKWKEKAEKELKKDIKKVKTLAKKKVGKVKKQVKKRITGRKKK